MIGRRTVDVVRADKIGWMWIIVILSVVPLPVVLRNMTETPTGPVVTFIMIVPT